MGDLVQLRDYQSSSAIERAHKALEEHLNQQAIQIANEAFPSVIIQPEYTPMKFWPSDYRPPEKDGA